MVTHYVAFLDPDRRLESRPGESFKEFIEREKANLAGANLNGAKLDDADLGGADLGGADLGGANLNEAVLAGANLNGADLKRAYLFGAYLVGAEADDKTVWPEGFDPKEAGVRIVPVKG